MFADSSLRACFSTYREPPSTKESEYKVNLWDLDVPGDRALRAEVAGLQSLIHSFDPVTRLLATSPSTSPRAYATWWPIDTTEAAVLGSSSRRLLPSVHSWLDSCVSLFALLLKLHVFAKHKLMLKPLPHALGGRQQFA